MKKYKHNDGFTLIEVLVVIGIVAILSAVVLVAINPGRQFKIARDSQRTANVTAILDAVGQNISENKGIFTCNNTPFVLPSTAKNISSDSAGVHIAPCLVPTYISALPFDPLPPHGFTSTSSYDTGYTIQTDNDGRVMVTAQSEITGDPIVLIR